MSRLNVNDARCEALFVSPLQASDALTPEAVTEAINRAIRQLGSRGCAARMAQEFGEHPDLAVLRMRWVQRLVTEVFSSIGPRRTNDDQAPADAPRPRGWFVQGASRCAA
jgi:hypothetical protein